MKKLFFVALFLGSASMSFAQLSQGTLEVGGSIGYTSVGGNTTTTVDNVDDVPADKVSSLEIVPSVGYFVADNISIGLGIGYASFKEQALAGTDDSGDDITTTNNMIMIAPYGRYYMSLGDQFAFFGQLRVGLGFGSQKIENGSDLPDSPDSADLPKSRLLDIGLEPGFAFFPVETVGIELSMAGLRYQSFKTTTKVGNDDTSTVTESGFGFGTNFTENSGTPNNVKASGITGFFTPKLGVRLFF